MTTTERIRFTNRMSQRKTRHGKNWRQIYVDCGGMCVVCYAVDFLEFHEPFGESKASWLVFQARVLECSTCHSLEHTDIFIHDEDRYIRASRLQEDVNIEILMEGGYNNWIKNHGLVDRFAYLIMMKE